jgi:predicted transcriptional regulator
LTIQTDGVILREITKILKRGCAMNVYEKVRSYIDDHGLKQTAVAKKAAIPMTTFNAILNGKRTMYADELRAICLALNPTGGRNYLPLRALAHAFGWIPEKVNDIISFR